MKVTKTDRKSRGMDLDVMVDFLNKAPVGRVAMISPDGVPYVVPVNFAYDDGRIYFHCALEGMKLDYIRANPSVGFETDELISIYASADRPCFCGSNYQSVIARGRATIVADREKKLQALWLLVDKYVGKRYGEMPDDLVDRTAVVEIAVDEISGKAYLPTNE